ncbi:hypothetical protein Emag_003046 [Eimeria magna]
MGVDENRVLRWDAAAQHELKEAMFTAVTAAASGAGPTYVKFLQWVATRPDRSALDVQIKGSPALQPPDFLPSWRPFTDPLGYKQQSVHSPIPALRFFFANNLAKLRHISCTRSNVRSWRLWANRMRMHCTGIQGVPLAARWQDRDSRRRFLQHAFVLGEEVSRPTLDTAQNGEGSIPAVVAAKIMRPGVRESMIFDLRLMLLLAFVVQRLPAFKICCTKENGYRPEWLELLQRALQRGLGTCIEF